MKRLIFLSFLATPLFGQEQPKTASEPVGVKDVPFRVLEKGTSEVGLLGLTPAIKSEAVAVTTNCADVKIAKVRAGLGKDSRFVELKRDPANSDQWQVPDEEGIAEITAISIAIDNQSAKARPFICKLSVATGHRSSAKKPESWFCRETTKGGTLAVEFQYADFGKIKMRAGNLLPDNRFESNEELRPAEVVKTEAGMRISIGYAKADRKLTLRVPHLTKDVIGVRAELKHPFVKTETPMRCDLVL